MYTILKHISLKKLASSELPALGLSFIIAEAFYKFGSFTLECIAFLGTWYLASYLFNTVFVKKKNTIPEDNII